LASIIRINQNVNGIKLPHPSEKENDAKLTMFVDDTKSFNSGRSQSKKHLKHFWRGKKIQENSRNVFRPLEKIKL
jgi:hypothetical protein